MNKIQKRVVAGLSGIALTLVSLASAPVAFAAPADVIASPTVQMSVDYLPPCNAFNDGARAIWNGKEFECRWMGWFSWEWVLVGGSSGGGGHF